MILHRHRQKRLRVIFELIVETTHAGKIDESGYRHRVRDRFAGIGGISGYGVQIRLAVFPRNKASGGDIDCVAALAALDTAAAIVDRNVE